MRTAFVALASLLLGIGLGRVADQYPDLGMVAIAIALMLFGIAGLLSVPGIRRRVPFARTAEDQGQALRVALAARLTTGAELMAELGTLTDEVEQIQSVEKRAVTWATEVREFLDQKRPGWSAVFLSNSIHVQYLSQHQDRDRVRNWLEQRVAALRGLVERV